jgi:hypothetical protein
VPADFEGDRTSTYSTKQAVKGFRKLLNEAEERLAGTTSDALLESYSNIQAADVYAVSE